MEVLSMAKLIQVYVEGKSDQTFLEGSQFRDFTMSLGVSAKVKNLKNKGNVTSNFEKYLKIRPKTIFATILLHDQDCSSFDSAKIDEIIKKYKKTFHCIAIQEIEGWYLADIDEISKIDKNYKPINDTQSITDPKSSLKNLFLKANKGFKTEMGFAEYFKDKINFAQARKQNKSLNKFLSVLEMEIA